MISDGERVYRADGLFESDEDDQVHTVWGKVSDFDSAGLLGSFLVAPTPAPVSAIWFCFGWLSRNQAQAIISSRFD